MLVGICESVGFSTCAIVGVLFLRSIGSRIIQPFAVTSRSIDCLTPSIKVLVTDVSSKPLTTYNPLPSYEPYITRTGIGSLIPFSSRLRDFRRLITVALGRNESRWSAAGHPQERERTRCRYCWSSSTRGRSLATSPDRVARRRAPNRGCCEYWRYCARPSQSRVQAAITRLAAPGPGRWQAAFHSMYRARARRYPSLRRCAGWLWKARISLSSHART